MAEARDDTEFVVQAAVYGQRTSVIFQRVSETTTKKIGSTDISEYVGLTIKNVVFTVKLQRFFVITPCRYDVYDPAAGRRNLLIF